MSIPTAYQGEALLLRWSETANGRTVTLQLDPHVGDQHPFKSLKCGPNGQRMQIVAVLVGDDEQPVEPPQDKPKKPKTRSQIAAIKLQSEDFQIWLAEEYPKQWDGFYIDQNMISSEAADAVFKTVLGIESKAELDTDAVKAARFDAMLADYSVKDIRR